MSFAPARETCPVCRDTGWKPAASDPASGKPGRVTRCDCRLAAQGAQMVRAARIPARYADCHLLNFQLDGMSDSIRQAHLVATAFVREFTPHAKGLLFTGSLGSGKTHMAVGIIRDLMELRGVPCLFYDYRELLKEIQNSYNSSVNTTELEVLRPVFDSEVLVLDELGAVKPTEWVWDTVSLILNTRYNDKRTTIITTNFPDGASAGAGRESERSAARQAARDETLGDRVGDRMLSRLHEMCRFVSVQGSDFRRRELKSVGGLRGKTKPAG